MILQYAEAPGANEPESLTRGAGIRAHYVGAPHALEANGGGHATTSRVVSHFRTVVHRRTYNLEQQQQ